MSNLPNKIIKVTLYNRLKAR